MDRKMTAAVATMTWARHKEEAALLLSSLRALSSAGVCVFVTDGGSIPGFVSQIENLPNVNVVCADASLFKRIKISMRRAMASGAEIVAYTEPDKQFFFGAGLAGLLQRAIDEPQAAVVVAARDGNSFATYPLGRRRIETALNRLTDVFVGQTADWVYGPMTIKTAILAECLEPLPDDLGWGFRTYLMARCSKIGQRVIPYEGFFPCPEEQQYEDDETSRLYRLEQLIDSARGLHCGIQEAVRNTVLQPPTGKKPA